MSSAVGGVDASAFLATDPAILADGVEYDLEIRQNVAAEPTLPSQLRLRMGPCQAPPSGQATCPDRLSKMILRLQHLQPRQARRSRQKRQTMHPQNVAVGCATASDTSDASVDVPSDTISTTLCSDCGSPIDFATCSGETDTCCASRWFGDSCSHDFLWQVRIAQPRVKLLEHARRSNDNAAHRYP